MSTLNVLRLGHPILRQKSEAVPEGDLTKPSFRLFIKDMIDTMRDYDGVGLAAPQVGESVRLVVIECAANPRYPESPVIPLTVLINPIVRPVTLEKATGWEGCLSVPDLRGRVPRFREIAVEALDPEGRPLKFTAKDFMAVVIQHETDHLDGIVYLDRMEGLDTLAFLEEFQEYWSGNAGAL